MLKGWNSEAWHLLRFSLQPFGFLYLTTCKNDKSRKKRNFKSSYALILERMRWRRIQAFWLQHKWLRRSSSGRPNLKKNSTPSKNQIQKKRGRVPTFKRVHGQPMRHYQSVNARNFGASFGMFQPSPVWAFISSHITKWKHSEHLQKISSFLKTDATAFLCRMTAK